MTPGNPLYFDALPDAQSVYNVYHFSVVPKGLTIKEAGNIQGAQANIWTEYIPTEQRADYMYMPRMTALAEVLWSGGTRYEFLPQSAAAALPAARCLKCSLSPARPCRDWWKKMCLPILLF